MFNRSKDQCVFCDYSPSTAASQSKSQSLAEAAAAAMRARRNTSSLRMTPRVLRDICKEHDAPTCNLAVVQLHLNCVGFDAIDECISNYPAVGVAFVRPFARFESRLRHAVCSYVVLTDETDSGSVGTQSFEERLL